MAFFVILYGNGVSLWTSFGQRLRIVIVNGSANRLLTKDYPQHQEQVSTPSFRK
jgi:hypothetical protein